MNRCERCGERAMDEEAMYCELCALELDEERNVGASVDVEDEREDKS